jgi:hypothetical protein
MVVDLSMDRAQFLQCLRASKPLHGSFSSSKGLMRVFRAVVEPTANLVTIAAGFETLLNHLSSRGLPGGAKGIQTVMLLAMHS